MNPVFLSGQYDTGLVLLSYLVAALAAYCAVDLVERISRSQRRQWLWLGLGAAAMGTGIWAMHFIGMQSFSLPIPLGYDLLKTVLSWGAAVAVALLALWAASRQQLGPRAVVAGALLMGAGICVMHYLGMFAMEMQPGIVWTPWLVLASALIAVVASGAALWILFQLRGLNARYKLWARFGAAAIMGLAVIGMHYTGMAAANFPVGSLCGAADSLNGAWTGIPLAAITGALTLLTMVLAAQDARAQARAVEEARQRAQEERARVLALYDSATMMRNRASFQQEVVGLIQRCERSGRHFDLFYGALRFPGLESEAEIDEAMRVIAERLRPLVRQDDFLARYSRTEVTLLRRRLHEADLPSRLREQLMVACTLPMQLGERIVMPQAHVGSGHFPADGRHSRQLLQAAARTSVTSVPSAPPPSRVASGAVVA